MKRKTRWKRIKLDIIGQKCFNEEFGFFTIKKIWECKEYFKSAITPEGSQWFTARKVLVVTDTGLKYTVPYLWLIFNSIDASGKLLAK